MLSIIIVNYNVQYFTGQCLCSVQKAIAGIDAEVLVVDNNSADESVVWITENFPWVKCITNKENTGYARANNQGWHMAKGDYILFLNPDTILSEGCLRKSLAVLQHNKQLGALGIHMIDGSGRFLPESKRGFPSLAASFCKLSGLVKIFPRSRRIAGYYMGWMGEKDNNEIEVLSGAFMMVKKEVLEKTGGFDERFFMYGEDIDLSYRIKLAGYKNYYLGEDSIIHFKGESTKKDIRYTKLFYKAMDIFVQKHYGKRSRGFGLLMQLAIAVRGALSFSGRLFINQRQKLPAGIIHTLLVGGPVETKKVVQIVAACSKTKRKISIVPGIKDIEPALQAGKTDEIIFCEEDLSYSDIIHWMEDLGKQQETAFKFFATANKTIVGSSSKNSSGEVMVLAEDSGKAQNRFRKG